MDVETEDVCLYSLFRLEKRWRFQRKDFEETIWLPFEDTQIAAPAGYEHILKQLYNDWQVLKKLPTMHSEIDGTFFDTENAYTTYIDPVNGIKKGLIPFTSKGVTD